MLTESLTIVSVVSAVISAAMGVMFWLTVRRIGALHAISQVEGTGPTVSVIVPARNEQADLAAALRSICDQEGVQLQVIVVNDHSSDQTGAIADSFAESDQRVIVIHNPPLAAGWLGKANAMETAFRQATGEFLVFADADVIHDRRCFISALTEFQRHPTGMLSLLPKVIMESFWENALLPHAVMAATVQFCAPGVNNPDSPHAAAAGAFMLVRRETVEQLHGLDCIKSDYLDDVALAKAVKRIGHDSRVILAPDLVKVRLFKGNRDAFWGFTKNILMAVSNIWVAIPTMFLPIFVYWLPLVCLALGTVSLNWTMIAAGGSAYLIQACLLFPARKLCQFRWGKALFFPFNALPVLCCFTMALYYRLSRGSVAWRGRVVRIV
ncbi:MAG TPA: glycosyltransferase family 2 protein, partial [Schlesneria sp.]